MATLDGERASREQELAGSLAVGLDAYVAAAREFFDLPALSVAILSGDQRHAGAAGVLNVRTGAKATTDSAFQIGSISKIFTASLVMDLVIAGRIDLDAPARRYLREFHVADRGATERVTIRQLLCHTSGIAGDFFTDAENLKDDTIARYVDRCYWLPQVHAPGERVSYCNAGYSFLGLLTERLEGASWFDLVERKIFRPLSLATAITHPLDLLRVQGAIGHRAGDGGWEPADPAFFGLGAGPLGGTLSMSPTDLITFASAHLDGGIEADGRAWLHPEAAAEMIRPQAALHDHAPLGVTDWGLGWFLLKRGRRAEHFVFGHDGGTPGQQSFLRIMPSRRFAVAVNINAESPQIFPLLADHLFRHFVGEPLNEPAAQLADAGEAELARFVGVFDSLGQRVDIQLAGKALTVIALDRIYDRVRTRRFLPLGEGVFEAQSVAGERLTTVAFLDFDANGRPASLHQNFRLLRRTDGAADGRYG